MDNENAKMPDALVIGPMKAGTTWIDRYLRERGDIVLPTHVKETFFFDRNYARGDAWYSAHFSNASKGQVDLPVIEVAPSYFHSQIAPARIVESLGKVPLIVVLRDPVKRAYSHYLHQLRYGFTNANLRTAALEFPEIIDASCYASQLSRWLDEFGTEKVLILFQQDLAEAPAEFVKKLCTHFSFPYVPPAESLQGKVNQAAIPSNPKLAALGQNVADKLRSAGLYQVINLAKGLGLKSLFFGKSGGKPLPSLGKNDAEWLYEKLLPEIESLEEMMGIDLANWKND